MGTRRALVACVMGAACLAGAAGLSSGQDKDAAAVKEELSPRMRGLRTDFDRLVKLMLDGAQVLEKSDPEAARSLREAVDLAQRAFIADNMAQAAAELEKGMAGKALDTQADVIKNLDELIRLLRYGTLGLEAKLAQIANYKEQLERINKHLEDQKRQQEISKAKAQAEKTAGEMAAHARTLEEIIAGQKALHRKAGDLKGATGALEKALELRNEIRNMIAKQQVLREKTQTSPLPRLTKAGAIQEALADRAGALGRQLQAAGKEPPPTDLTKAAAAAAEKVAQASGNMKQAAQALSEMDRQAAGGKQDQSLQDLEAAEKALTKAIEGSPDASAGRKAAGEQAELAKKTEQLAQAVQATAQAAGAQADTGHLAEAGGQMQQASEKLSQMQPPQARGHMEKALEALKEKQVKLANLADLLKKKARKPLDKQEAEQKQLGSETGKTAQGMKGSDSSRNSPGQPGVEKAAGEMNKAAGQIGQDDQSGADASQSKAIEELARARQELERAIEETQAEAQNEQLAQMDRLLARILEAQKELSKATQAVHKKHPGEGKSYARQEQMEVARLANGEGALADEVEKVRDLLKREGTTTVFPEVLQDVWKDLRGVRKLLEAQEAGAFVQSEQADIEGSLEEMIAALRKEQARRNKKGGEGAGGGGGGGGGRDKEALVPPVAELKLLRIRQQQIAERTVALDRERSAAPAATKLLADQHKELAERQGKLANLTQEIAEKTRKAAAKAAAP